MKGWSFCRSGLGVTAVGFKVTLSSVYDAHHLHSDYDLQSLNMLINPLTFIGQ